jgi:hypothetical protein
MRKNLPLLFLAMSTCSLLYATTSVVTNSATSGDGSLATIVSAASNGDTITFNVDSTTVLLDNAITMKSLVVNGLNVYNNTPIVLKQTTAGRGLFSLASGITAKLSHLIIDGTGLLGNTAITTANGSTLYIDSCVFRNINAQANNGGATRIQGAASITNSSFEGNTTGGGYGGGALCIYNAASVSIDKCSFIGNISNINGTNKNGGGAIVARSTAANPLALTITNSTFANNKSQLMGGAILATVQSSTNYVLNLSATNCTFTGNQGIGAINTLTTINGTVNVQLINCIAAYNIDTLGTSYMDVVETKGTNESTVSLVTPNHVLYSNAATMVTAGHQCILIDPTTADVFSNYSSFGTGLKRPELSVSGGMTVAMISSTSLAIGAGMASTESLTVPTIDQLGQTRPSIPSIGAVEYKILTETGTVKAENNVVVFATGKNIKFYGLDKKAAAEIYSLTGLLLKKEVVENGSSVTLNNASEGLYIVKINGKGYKVLFR